MDDPIDRGFFCAPEDTDIYLQRKYYRNADGYWARRLKAGGVINSKLAGIDWTPKKEREMEDCTKCKHKLRCLIDRDCDSTFESR